MNALLIVVVIMIVGCAKADGAATEGTASSTPSAAASSSALEACNKDYARVNFSAVDYGGRGQDPVFFENVKKKCEAAAKEDPSFEPTARERIAKLDDAIKRRTAALASASVKAEVAEQEKMKELRTRVSRSAHGSDRDATCTGQGNPPYRFEYTGGTYKENRQVAEADGCKPTFKFPENTSFCCPEPP